MTEIRNMQDPLQDFGRGEQGAGGRVGFDQIAKLVGKRFVTIPRV